LGVGGGYISAPSLSLQKINNFQGTAPNLHLLKFYWELVFRDYVATSLIGRILPKTMADTV